MPGIWSTHLDTSEGRIELVDVEPGRATYRVRAGAQDATLAFALRELDERDASRALFAVGAGAAPERHPRGLATGGKLVVPMTSESNWGQLVVAVDGSLSIAPSEEHRAADSRFEEAGDARPPSSSPEDRMELPTLVWNGRPTAGPAPGPPAWRSAVGVTASGRVLLARGHVTNHGVLAEALSRAGCERALAMDRGGAGPDRWERREKSGPVLRSRGAESVLYVLASTLAPRGIRLDSLRYQADRGVSP
jgi:hypothetical protein